MSHPEANCVFCKIVAGTLPAARVLETGEVLAFLDIGPLAPGHTLVIPKAHYTNLPTLPDEVAAALGAVLPRVCRAVVAATGAEGLNVLSNTGAVAGQSVEHVHWHVIPRRFQDGIAWPWRPLTYADGELEAMRRRIACELSG
ncbi:MAG: hydrolase [Isosphaeraceae bacterium]|jgi:histidine triad (HIT) family protein|nr:MAG: hydrolase [Isosphaeraceae bacterium]